MMTRLLACLMLLASAPASADDNAEIAALLETPGIHAIMRHALAPGGGDPANLTIGDCSTQRNLDDRGREQARRIGETLRAMGAGFDEVRTSEWCRCAETADLLGLGAVTRDPVLNSFFRDRSEGPAQTAALRAWLAGLPDDRRVMLVTHQVNVTALTDVFPSSGEIVLIEMDDAGQVTVRGTMEIDP